MNNRIMAMLCTLAAAMFLSIVPVKAEAATCSHKNKDYVPAKAATCEEAGHDEYFVCKSCKQMIVNGKVVTAKDVETAPTGHKYSEKWFGDDENHWHICKNGDCESHSDVTAHELKYTTNGPKTHSMQCTVCGEKPTALQHAAHNYVFAAQSSQGKPYHKMVCSDCGQDDWVDCVDENNDCKCDVCGAEMPHSVENLEYVKGKTESCKESGYYNHYKCPHCGKTFWTQGNGVVECDPTIKQLEHVWEIGTDDENHFYICKQAGCEEKKDVEAHTFKYTVNSDGTHSASCTVCGRKPVALQNVAHNYVFAAQSSQGKPYHKMVCSDCEDEKWVDCVDENGDCKCDVCGAEMPHDSSKLTYIAAKDPSCTEDGNKDYFLCEQCGGKFWANGSKREDVVIPATGHTWEYDGMMYGKHFAVCKTCKERELLDHEDTNGDCLCDIEGCNQLVHSHKQIFVSEVPATCEEDGTEGYYTYQDCGKMFDLEGNPIEEPVTIKATGHEMSGEWVPGENGQHVMYCVNCDYCETEDHVFKNGNVTCDICGAEENLTHVDAKAATCTEQGNVEYWTSKVTGKKYADEAGTKELKDVTIPATDHKLTGFVDDGNGRHSQHCQNPGCSYVEGSGIHKAAENGCFCADCGAALDGHELTLVPAVAATCEKAGTEAYFQCSCGKKYDLSYELIEKPASIAKLSHTTDGTVKKDDKEGKHYTECTTCGKKFYEEHVMAVKDPMKGNYHQYVCACGKLEVEQHYDKDGDGVCDACGHSMNRSSVTVEQHDNVTVKTGDSSTNGNNTWWRNWLEALIPGNSGGSAATAEKEETTVSSNQQSASANQNQTASTSQNTTQSNTQNTNTASSGTNSGASKTTVNNNALAQFFTWFLGLFGF